MLLSDHLRRAETPTLSIGYAELGPADGPAVLLLHGWPYDIHTYAEVAPLLAAGGHRVIVPYQRGFGSTRFRDSTTLRNGQQAVLALDVAALMDALGIETATLGGADWGARAACCVAALWPERCTAVVPVSGYLISSQAAGAVPLSPGAEQTWWYQYYFATERGRRGYAQHRRAFAQLIWQTASPRWPFDEAVFARSASALDNQDHAAIVVHNYRWRLGLAEGDPRLDDLEARLAATPPITVPAISLEGDANGAPHPDPTAYAGRFVGPYEHRTLSGGIGHNLPQEAPEAFAAAIVTATQWGKTKKALK
ncbi:alpha/beta hydrolase [Devosia insulae DS-56]|uniref:Alpha/beta hydrolase n=2 Tax=Devosia insulae TaxID=408174 RepID=A0A1E5XIS6_9HYPH|nr:alpha/beta hydrolase [Devosia insulae]OEO28502.1 alpha/beta hydrolase [Devosia insulae DS-56]